MLRGKNVVMEESLVNLSREFLITAWRSELLSGSVFDLDRGINTRMPSTTTPEIGSVELPCSCNLLYCESVYWSPRELLRFEKSLVRAALMEHL